MKEILVDQKSVELARHFLTEPHQKNREATEARVMSLARAIQEAVETWFYEE